MSTLLEIIDTNTDKTDIWRLEGHPSNLPTKDDNVNALAIVVPDTQYLDELLAIDFCKTTIDKVILDLSSTNDFLNEAVIELQRCYLSVEHVSCGDCIFVVCKTRRSQKLVKVIENRQKRYQGTESKFLEGLKLDTKKAKTKVKMLTVQRILTEDQVKEKAGHFYNLQKKEGEPYDIQTRGYCAMEPIDDWKVVAENCDVIDKDTGKVILKFRKQVIPFELQKVAYDALVASAKFTRNANRGVAGGIVDAPRVRTVRPKLEVGRVDKYRLYPKLPSGEPSKGSLSNPAKSAIIGWTDIAKRSDKGRPCRLTAYTAQHMDQYQESIPFFERINSLYSQLAPEEYNRQLAEAQKTHARVGNTAFSSITVNYEWRSALHKDIGDYKGGYGCFTVCQPSETGGELMFPEYGLAVRVCSGDLLLFDSHAWHCTAPLGDDGDRLSFVCYLRDRIKYVCPNVS